MHIVGEQVILRAIERADLPSFLAWSNDPEIAVQLGEIHFPTSQSQHDRWFDRIDTDEKSIRLAVTDKSNRLIGYSGFWGLNWRARHAEHAVVIGDSASRSAGFGSDVIWACAKHAFEQLDLQRLYCNILATNTVSLACYQSCGFQIEGTLRKHQFRNNSRVDQIVLGLLRSEFASV
jgi:RimJ/RimL family protein N-acetyltransferase